MRLEEIVITLVVGSILLAGAFGGAYWLMSTKCENQWARSGMKSEYAMLQGCMVQRKDGTWIPASSYREVAN